jgi:hypothetical protein
MSAWGLWKKLKERKADRKGMTELDEKLGRIILWREGELGM